MAQWATFADVVDAQPASGRVYLPTASYQEMGEWALPTDAGRALEEAKRDLGPLDGGARLVALLRGGFWRNFLVKYPEVAEIYWKMLRLSAAVDPGARSGVLTTRRWCRRARRCGAARPTTRTGTACSAAAISRTCAGR